MSVVARFQKMLDSLFNRLGVEGEYVRTGEVPIPVRLIPRRPEHLLELGDHQIHAVDPVFDIRRSEIARPVRGDVIVYEGLRYRIEAEPTLERQNLVWVVETLPLDE